MVSASLARELMHALKEAQETNSKMSADYQQMKKEVRRLTRRQSMVVPPATPLPSPPKVSSTTHSTYARLQTPTAKAQQTTRMSLGGGVSHAYVDLSEEEVDTDGEEVKESSPDQEEVEDVDPTDAAKLAKIMAKVKVPKSFSGATEEEREGVQAWANDVSNYLYGQFGQLKRRYPEKEWTVALPLFESTARMWVDNARIVNPHMTWEELKPSFIEFIRGGRESRTVQVERMSKLVYGQGKCKDLLSLEKEFEELRMRLYPSSSTSPEMNEIVGRWYSEAIARGDPDLYETMTYMLGGIDQPTLSQWKAVAARAVQVKQVTAAARKGRLQSRRAWNWRGSVPTEKVNEVSEGVEGEEETDDSGAATVQQMQGRRGSTRNSKPPLILSNQEYKLVMDKGLCLQCYKPGHCRGDAACKEKGKERRKPTAEELKALKA
jgi:hypothetical protein